MARASSHKGRPRHVLMGPQTGHALISNSVIIPVARCAM